MFILGCGVEGSRCARHCVRARRKEKNVRRRYESSERKFTATFLVLVAVVFHTTYRVTLIIEGNGMEGGAPYTGGTGAMWTTAPRRATGGVLVGRRRDLWTRSTECWRHDWPSLLKKAPDARQHIEKFQKPWSDVELLSVLRRWLLLFGSVKCVTIPPRPSFWYFDEPARWSYVLPTAAEWVWWGTISCSQGCNSIAHVEEVPAVRST